MLGHEVSHNVVLSDVVKAGELDALRGLKVEAVLRKQVDEVLQEARSVVFSCKLCVQAIIELLFVGQK